MKQLPEFICDEKDPLIYKKTMQYEKDCLAWDQRYLEKKTGTTYETLTDGMPS